MPMIDQSFERVASDLVCNAWQRDFLGGIREETQVGTEIKVQYVQGGKPHADAVGRISKVMVEVSADFVKKQGDVSIGDRKLFDLRVLRQKGSIRDMSV